MIISSGIVCDFCDKHILIKTFKTIENYHICQDCEKIAKSIIKEKGEINSEELMKICKK